MSRSIPMLLPPLALLAACGGGLKDETFPTGSRTLAVDGQRTHVFTVNEEENSVSVMDLGTHAVTTQDVGVRPARIAPLDDGAVVTLQGERSLAVLGANGAVREKVQVGAEPIGVVTSEGGKRAYVAVSQEDVVREYDTSDWSELRSFSVMDQPNWLALHPSGKALFVASPLGRVVQRIDLKSGEVADLALPETTRVPTEVKPNGNEVAGEEVTLTVRVTGDIAILPDGSALGVPTLYVDNISEVLTTEEGTDTVGGGYGSAGELTVSRMNPAVVSIPLNRDGEPDASESKAIFAGAFGMESVVRSYPSGLTPAPDGLSWLVSMEGSNTVVVIATSPSNDNDEDHDFSSESFDTGGRGIVTSLSDGGFEDHGRASLQTDFGPRGVSFIGDDEVLVHHWGARSVGRLDARELLSDARHDRSSTWTLDSVVTVAESKFSADVEAGRTLFNSAIDSRMAGDGAGVSCSTCHLNGRNDGLSWPLEDGLRQTPTLVGGMAATEPMTWSDEVLSVGVEARLTSSGRMGGEGLSNAESALIEAYVEQRPGIDNPDLGSADSEVLVGAEIFARADVGCAGCHTGERYTDNKSYALFSDLEMNTPSLTGVRATAPYLHDGSAATLRGVLEASRSGAMGDTSMLSDIEMTALVRFLESL